MAGDSEPEKVSEDVEDSSIDAHEEDEYAHGSRLLVIMISLLIGKARPFYWSQVICTDRGRRTRGQ
jgi:hypothetical protein